MKSFQTLALIFYSFAFAEPAITNMNAWSMDSQLNWIDSLLKQRALRSFTEKDRWCNIRLNGYALEAVARGKPAEFPEVLEHRVCTRLKGGSTP
jgi:hypothetical protein